MALSSARTAAVHLTTRILTNLGLIYMSDGELHEEADELAREIEVSIREFGKRIEEIPEYPIGQQARSEVIEVGDLM